MRTARDILFRASSCWMLPVCMITSSDETRDQEEAEAQGIEAYCVKPVAFDELVLLAHKIRTEAEEHCEKPDSCSAGQD